MGGSSQGAVTLGELPDVRDDPGYWKQAWARLRDDRSAMIGLALVSLLLVVAVLAPVLEPADPAAQASLGLTESGQPLGPSGAFLLGTDALGRDELSRVIDAARVSLLVGIGANVLAVIIGLAVGGIAGMSRGFLQSVLMRAVDVVLSFPILLLSISLLAVTEPRVTTIVAIIGVGFGAYVARLVFSQTTSLREREFVLAARASGVRAPAILLRHVIPHVLPSVLVFAALGTATAIQLEAALSYVGIGIQPPRASWGNMISEGQVYITSAPWLVLVPGVAILLATFGFSLLGDGLRDALDPTLERRAGVLGAGAGVR